MSISPGFGAAGLANLSADDVGARVSVRRTLGAQASDIVGDLLSLDADQLAVRLRDGSTVRVPADDVVAARRVGFSMLAVRDLEEVSARGWRGVDEAWLGRWWLRGAQGFTARANSVRVLGSSGRPLDDALAEVVTWYGARGLVPKIRVPASDTLDRELADRGWSAHDEAVLLTATVAAMRRRLADVPRPPAELADAQPPVELADAPSPAWLARYRDGNLPPIASTVLCSGSDVAFAVIPTPNGGGSANGRGGEAAAIGRVVVDGAWAGFAAIEVAPDARRAGYASAIMSALVEWASRRGALRTYLEVLADNAPALALYEKLGFTQHHQYAYRQPPTS